eukprot:8306179-Lingulodinium_polyedra.AAC.1
MPRVPRRFSSAGRGNSVSVDVATLGLTDARGPFAHGLHSPPDRRLRQAKSDAPELLLVCLDCGRPVHSLQGSLLDLVPHVEIQRV